MSILSELASPEELLSPDEAVQFAAPLAPTPPPEPEDVLAENVPVPTEPRAPSEAVEQAVEQEQASESPDSPFDNLPDFPDMCWVQIQALSAPRERGARANGTRRHKS